MAHDTFLKWLPFGIGTCVFIVVFVGIFFVVTTVGLTARGAERAAWNSVACTREGVIGTGAVFDKNANTWRVPMYVPNPEGQIFVCPPMCIVDAETETGVMDWHCEGMIGE